MAFSNKKYIKGRKECVWCGWKQSYLDAAHLIDEIGRPSVNGVWMCKNCHAVFDDVFRPLLFKALVAYGVSPDTLPPSWRKPNKVSDPADLAAGTLKPTPAKPPKNRKENPK
jgi:hypothetical protein